jgi:hypothetical protein
MGVMRQLRKSLKQGRQYESLRRKLEQNKVFGDKVKLVGARRGRKMSDVFVEYAEPLLDPSVPYSEQDRVIKMAVMCWNLSLLPKDEREALLRDGFVKSKEPSLSDGVNIIVSMVEEMIERKERLFANDKRMIIEWNIEPGADEELLTIAYMPIRMQPDKEKL